MRPPRLTRVDFRGGYISFEYAVVNSVTTWNLQLIKIHNDTHIEPIQTVSLSKSAFSNGEQRLDKVSFTNVDGESYDYEFGYKGEPVNLYEPGGFYKGIDYWGYFNGSFVPHGRRYTPIFEEMHDELSVGTSRTPNDDYAQMGILNKIVFPTKGFSEFTFEGHQARYSEGTPIIPCGGLRIKEIRKYLADGSLAEKRWYVYGENESGVGIANTYPNSNDFFSESRVLIDEYSQGLFQVRITEHWSSMPKIGYFISGSPVVYPMVTEYVGNDREAYGKTIYGYDVFPDEKVAPSGDTHRWNSADTYLRTYPWKTGKLLLKEVYRKEENTYHKVYSLRNKYEDWNTAEFRNVRVLPHVEFEYLVYDEYNLNEPDIKSNYCEAFYWQFRQDFGGSSPDLSPYDYFNYYITTGLRVLTSVEETTDGVAVLTQYTAYNAKGLPTEIVRTTSTGEGVTTTLKYPTEFGYSPYTDMVLANILTPVVEKEVSKAGRMIKKEIFRYGYWHSKFYAPLNYEVGYLDDAPVSRISYSYNSTANMREVSKVDDAKTVYLWGYKNRHPIAVIRNATYSQIESLLGQSLIDRIANAPTPASSDLAAINNLRHNTTLPGIHVMTYTYDPLIGMVSQTDANGRTTHYEYDSFERLKSIKDHDLNILQAYDYRYRQDLD